MEDDIKESQRQREICQDFLTANPNVQMVGIGNTLMDRAGVVDTKQRLEAPTLHSQIMNLPCKTTIDNTAYKLGHRDARHAAAELVLPLEDQNAYLLQRVREVMDINYALQEEIRGLRKAQGEPVATLQVFMTSHDMGNSLAPNPPFKVAIATAFQRAKEYPLGDYELYTSAPTIPEGWLKICADEVQRTKLTSHPLKFAFAKEHGMVSLDEVHQWMSKVRQAFETMVTEATKPTNG